MFSVAVQAKILIKFHRKNGSIQFSRVFFNKIVTFDTIINSQLTYVLETENGNLRFLQ